MKADFVSFVLVNLRQIREKKQKNCPWHRFAIRKLFNYKFGARRKEFALVFFSPSFIVVGWSNNNNRVLQIIIFQSSYTTQYNSSMNLIISYCSHWSFSDSVVVVVLYSNSIIINKIL